MPHVVLLHPEIPPNTGNVIRLCANTASPLHLIHPLGFRMEDARLRRAGLDYREWARVAEHPDFEGFMAMVQPARLLAFSTRGDRFFHRIEYRPGDALLFGPETRGLPAGLLERADAVLRLPMMPGNRSLNLSNAVAVAVFEAWRQRDYVGGA